MNPEAMKLGDQAGDVVFNDIPARQPIKAVNIQEFLEHKFPPREYLLEPILQRQGLAMIYAHRGVGKTFVALNLAYAVASAGTVFTWKAPKQRRVLYIDGEMPGTVMQERLSQILASAPDSNIQPENLVLLTNDLQEFGLPDIGTIEGQEEIQPFTDSADLIIIDNIGTLCRTGAENKADDWVLIQEWALRMRAQGKSVLFIHHAGKGGAQRGTSKREDILDTVLSLKRPVDYEPNQGARFEVHFEKARGITGDAVNPFIAELSIFNGKCTWTAQPLEDSTREKVAILINEGMKQKDIAEELGLNKSVVSRHVKKARAEGLIHE